MKAILLLQLAAVAASLSSPHASKDGSLLRGNTDFPTTPDESPLGQTDEDEGIRIYKNLDDGIQLGVHHPSSITAAADIAVVAERASLAYLSRHSGTGMTGLGGGTGGTGGTGSTGGTGGAFNYQKFEADVSSATEKTLVRLFDSTHSALQATRDVVLVRNGFPSASLATASSATGTAAALTGKAALGKAALGKAATGTAATFNAATGIESGETSETGSNGEETGSTGSATGSDNDGAGAGAAQSTNNDAAAPQEEETNGATGTAVTGQPTPPVKAAEDKETKGKPPHAGKDLEHAGHNKWIEGVGAGDTRYRENMLKKGY